MNRWTLNIHNLPVILKGIHQGATACPWYTYGKVRYPTGVTMKFKVNLCRLIPLRIRGFLNIVSSSIDGIIHRDGLNRVRKPRILSGMIFQVVTGMKVRETQKGEGTRWSVCTFRVVFFSCWDSGNMWKLTIFWGDGLKPPIGYDDLSGFSWSSLSLWTFTWPGVSMDIPCYQTKCYNIIYILYHSVGYIPLLNIPIYTHKWSYVPCAMSKVGWTYPIFGDGHQSYQFTGMSRTHIKCGKRQS